MPDALKTIQAALEALYKLPPGQRVDISNRPAFAQLKVACEAAFPNSGKGIGLSFALGNALKALGLSQAPRGQAAGAFSAADVALQLKQAFEARSTRRIHLCPLDGAADDLPELRFGPAVVRSLSQSELCRLVGGDRLTRAHPNTAFDAKRFSEFKWLVVEEKSPVDREPGSRAVPFLSFKLNEDFGRIEPHKGRFPKAVEDALFFLLLARWEEWTHPEYPDWRAFNAPWVYTFDEDLFVRPAAPPSPDSLSWGWKSFTDRYGDLVEIKCPTTIDLSEETDVISSVCNRLDWSTVADARESVLFETPITHFFVRAFLSKGIDEFLAHVVTIEAALGAKADSQGAATRRVAARVSALLGSNDFGAQYRKLFKIRSNYLHGRSVTAISSTDRVLARTLAREVVSALVQVVPDVRSRGHYLRALLVQGTSTTEE
jgi:hypothetical protein